VGSHSQAVVVARTGKTIHLSKKRYFLIFLDVYTTKLLIISDEKKKNISAQFLAACRIQ
jgi:hypothetical protein